MNKHSLLCFNNDGPFFEMVTAFLAATIGMGPVFDKNNPLALSTDKVAWYQGKISSKLEIDMGQIHAICTSGQFSADEAVKLLCCMLLNTAYAAVEARKGQTPIFEVFRHFRHAASHGNKFNFNKDEPKRPAAWGIFSIDHTLKGEDNPLYGIECIGATISPADVLALLQDIEHILLSPSSKTQQTNS